MDTAFRRANISRNMAKNLSVCYCLLALCLVISSISLVLTVILITKPDILLQRDNSPANDVGRDSELEPEEKPYLAQTQQDLTGNSLLDSKVYVFAYDVPWEEYQYVTAEGELRGLSVDIVDAVCNHARKKCQHIVVPIKYCWNSEDMIGTGILSRWFDSCAVFLKTTDRKNVFTFSGSFYRPKRGQFYFKADRSISVDKLEDLTIGVRSNWYISPDCLGKYNVKVDTYRKAENYEHLHTMLENDTVDVAFVEEDTYNNKQSLISTSMTFDCSLGGSGIMHRVDSDIPTWFNPSFEHIKRRGIFRDMCEKYPSVTESCLHN